MKTNLVGLDQVRELMARVGSHDPHDAPPNTFPTMIPYSMYCYIISIDDQMEYSTRLTYIEREDEIPSSAVPPILANIVSEFGPEVPPSVDLSTKWRKRSYLAFLIPGSTWQFSNPPMIFHGQENHSFFSGVTITQNNFSAFYCVNHMKRNDQGDDVGSEGQTFEYTLLLRPRVVPALATDGYMPIDGSGTNMGPPVAPPGILLHSR